MTNFVYKHEKPLFVISLIISVLFWLSLIVATLGGILLWFLLFPAYLFSHSALISYLKGTAVRITSDQFPDLHGRIVEACRKLSMKRIPDAFLLHGDGIFNAFATKFLGRNFIVLYSDIVDAIESNPDSVNFYIGHELGHLCRGHLAWRLVLSPASILPLLGAAYSRSKEYTCDLHGLACCRNPEDAYYGLATLAAGGKRQQTLNLNRYAAQVDATSEFWMSLHELIGDYPWLVKRMVRIMACANAAVPAIPRRHFLAWVTALFIPHIGIGRGSPALGIAMIIGVLAGIAVPAYRDYTVRAKVVESIKFSEQIKEQVTHYAADNKRWPSSNKDIGLNSQVGIPFIRSVVVNTGSIALTYASPPPQLEGKTLVLQPIVNNGRLSWDCKGGTLEARYRPIECQYNMVTNSGAKNEKGAF